MVNYTSPVVFEVSETPRRVVASFVPVWLEECRKIAARSRCGPERLSDWLPQPLSLRHNGKRAVGAGRWKGYVPVLQPKSHIISRHADITSPASTARAYSSGGRS